MRKSGIAILFLLVLATIYFLVNHFAPKKQPHIAPGPAGETQQPAVEPPKFPPSLASRHESGDSDSAEKYAYALPRETVEAYLTRYHRNASSLLAAFHASGDTNYLAEAATNFPTNPQVQLTILGRDAFPAERRKWLDAFKSSEPDNSLANYLSASDYFKNGRKEAALEELAAAEKKSRFKDYGIETQLDSESLNIEAGMSGRLAFMAGISAAAGDALQQLASCKTLMRDLMEVQKQHADAGDQNASASLIQMGMTLSRRFGPENSKLFIGQLVGGAMEAIVLSAMDQNSSSDLLGGKTPAQRLEELKQRKEEFRSLQQTLQASTSMDLSDGVWINFGQRQKIYGEVEAMRWLQRQNFGSTPSNGN